MKITYLVLAFVVSFHEAIDLHEDRNHAVRQIVRVEVK